MLSLTDSLQPTRSDAASGYSFVEELDVFVHDMFATLVKETRDELADPTYQRYRHGRCGTNNKGCSGPMCRWARRVWQAGNAADRARMRGKPYNPRPSLEKQLIHQLMELFDQHVEKVWTARAVGLTVKKEINRELSKAPAVQPVQAAPVTPVPPGNLQATELHGNLMMPVLI